MTRRSRLWMPLLLGGALALSACGQETLYSKLTEAQANEMVAVLQSAGVSAAKLEAGEKGWSITADPADFARSIEVLHAQGYPREEFATLGTVFKKEGFVSSPVEERARLLYGMSQELSHTVSEIDGVVQARVHLALPEAEPMAEKVKPASASVFIKYRPGFAMDAQVGKVKALVVNSVEGLSYDNVTVVTFPAQPLPVARTAGGSREVVANLTWVAVIGGLGLLASLMWPGFRRWQLRRSLPAVRGPMEDRSR
ncbi:type III secretion inner membrane ring lipoprotein SctJ [Sphingomonas sp. 1P06PA]|uniref:type III secretion system inner membrane ring lipoprotein SctJ n=1 Tax=Sphingomonas sp. 1P06PA TaxID=554121 RepID=UPI0039A723F0